MSYPTGTEETLLYLTECTLATITCMALRKRRIKSEYQRQIYMAQKGVDSIKDNLKLDNLDIKQARTIKVIFEYDGNVHKYAKTYEL